MISYCARHAVSAAFVNLSKQSDEEEDNEDDGNK